MKQISWHLSVNKLLRNKICEDHELQAILDYIGSLRPTQAIQPSVKIKTTAKTKNAQKCQKEH